MTGQVSIIIGVIIISLIGACLFIFKFTGSLTLFSMLIGSIGFFACVSAPLGTGGIYSPDLVSLVIVPVFTLMVGSKRVAYFWAVLSLLAFIAFYMLEDAGILTLKPLSANLPPLYYFQGIMTLAVMVLFLVFRNEKIRLELLDELKESNKIVSEKNKEVLDSIQYARRIQTSLMTPEKAIEAMIKRLKKD